MHRSKLGCLSVSGLAAFVLTLVLIGAAYALKGGEIFSPGSLSAAGDSETLNGVSSHAEIGPDCAACHAPPWSGSIMSNRCLACHQTVNNEFAASEGLHGPFVSNSARIDCLDCHTEHLGPEGDLTTISDEFSFEHHRTGFSLAAHTRAEDDGALSCMDCHHNDYSDFTQTVCLDCHQERDPGYLPQHTAAFGADCLSCHDGLETYGRNFDHNAVPFPLVGGHIPLACTECHAGAISIEMLRAAPQNCFACHLDDDSHQGEMGENCGVCHTPAGWDQAVFDHDSIGFPLTGRHIDLDCEHCHQPDTYQGLAAACAVCHLDDNAHESRFGEVCEACHSPSGWEFITFDHDLAGAADCQECHQADRPAGHYPGQCSSCHGTTAWEPASFDHQAAGAVDCLGCHSSEAPPSHFPGQCSLCHSTTAWVPASFSHTFPINHEGANSDCQLCHPGGNYAAYTCSGCHEHDPARMRSEHDEVRNFSENCIACHIDGREHEDGGDGEDDD